MSSLPIPLLLLIHLHILQFPLANNPEYDTNVFSLTRGLRERTKCMEEITHFLVERIEGRAKLKQIIPVWPCIQPQDTIAFRTALFKYLESLRNQTIRPPPPPKTKTKPAEPNVNVDAWWWKDVLVRKSLLEECAGERFERLLLALSTHALSKASAPRSISATDSLTLLRAQPSTYTTLQTSTLDSRRAWDRAAAVLLQRQLENSQLRACLPTTASKYDAVSTEKLVALKEARVRELARGKWSGVEGQKALEVFFEMGCVRGAGPLPEFVNKSPTLEETNRAATSALPPPLPTAAAYHPSTLRALRKPLVRPTPATTSTSTTAAATTTDLTPLLFTLAEEEIKRTYAALREAMRRAEKAGKELEGRVENMRRGDAKGLTLDLWRAQRGGRGVINWETEPTPDLLRTFLPDTSISHLEEQDPTSLLDSRIHQIRTELLPPFPPLDESPPLPPPPPPAVPDSPHEPERDRRVSIFPGVGEASAGRRRSVRFSVVGAVRRPSLFGGGLERVGDEDEDENEGEEQWDEASRIAHETQDTSISFHSPHIYTPKPGTRILTSGSPVKKLAAKTPRVSFMIPERKSLAALPPPDWLDDEDEGEEGGWGEQEEGSDEGGEGNVSITLRDILLKAGDGDDLLDNGEGDRENEDSFGWD